MIAPLLLCGALLGSPGVDGPAADSTDRETYKVAAASAGPDAAAQVRLALWCEAHGLTVERLEHLARAVREQPTNVLARGLMGLVLHRGSWGRPEAVSDLRRDDPGRQATEREYLDRRARTADRPDDQMKLADWCAKNGLKEAAAVHYRAVVRMEPGREAAWRHLGYRKQGSRWVRTDEIVAARREAARQKQADRHWRARLEKLRADLASKDPARRDRAAAGLDEVTDSRAVPSIWAVFVAGGPGHQMAALRMLGRIEGPSASHAIAALAVLNPWPEVRAAAIEALRRRDPRDVVGRLIGLVRKPIRYEVRPVPGSDAPGALYVDGRPFDLQQVYINPAVVPLLASGAGRLYSPDVPFDPFGPRNLMVASGAWAANLLAVTPRGLAPTGLAPTGLAPIDPSAAAQAARAIEVDPGHASAILTQLQDNPNNRDIPQGYSFALTAPAASIPVHELGRTNVGDQPVRMSAAQMQMPGVFIREVQAGRNNPLAPMGMAMELQKLENNPAHKQGAAVLGMMLPAQEMAARRDMELAMEMQRVRMAKLGLRQRLEMEVRFLEAANAGILKTDARVLPVLKAITGLDLGLDAGRWRAWWLSQLDRSPEIGSPGGDGAKAVAPATMRACFAIGTIVRTIDGPRPIESLQPGDVVLSQDPVGGGLAFRPVLAVHRSKPAATVRVAAGGESIEATGLQRFWRAGTGWTMARDLRPGDRLRALGGLVVVDSAGESRGQPVCNLEVAEDANLFVGNKGWLVHDFGFVPAVPEPFDRAPADPDPKGATARPLAREDPGSPTRSASRAQR